MSPVNLNITTCVGVVTLVLAAFLSSPISSQPWKYRLGWTFLTAILLILFAYTMLWTPIDSVEAEGKLNLACRVLGVEKRMLAPGTENESKQIGINFEIINRSKQSMILDFILLSNLRRENGTFFRLKIAGAWKRGSLSENAQSLDDRGSESVEVEAESVVIGSLYFTLLPNKLFPSMTNIESPDWDMLSNDNMSIVINDRFSGSSIVAPFGGYPPENVKPYIEQKIFPFDPVSGLGSGKAELIGIE